MDRGTNALCRTHNHAQNILVTPPPPTHIFHSHKTFPDSVNVCLVTVMLDFTLCFYTHTGVLTKLDIMDRGTNAMAALANLVVPLRLGYVAVVNRSQADINTNKTMAAARA
jgi:hypothetical protein